MLKKIGHYFSLVKFSHTVFSLPFALIGFFTALTDYHANFNFYLFLKVLLCVVFARNAAMGFNRYADRKFDAKNERTRFRDIPAGIVKPSSALWFIVLNAILFCCVTYFINPICFYLSPVALMVILSYSLMKRFTILCHLVLGVGLSLAPIGAYLAVAGHFDVLPVLFSGAVLFWVGGFDIIYALQDVDFDRLLRLHSIPAHVGKRAAIYVSIIFHVLSAIFIVFAGFYKHFGLLYLVGSFLFIGLLIYQHLLVKPDNLSKVNMAFFTLNGIASVVFSAFTIADLYFR